LSEYGIVGGAGGANPQKLVVVVIAVPSQPVLVPAQNGGSLDIIFGTQTGFSYQLQSTTNLAAVPANWVNEGGPVSGTGSSVTSSVPTSLDTNFFRVQAQ